MNKFLKIAGIVVIVIVVLFAGAYLVVKSYLTDERLRTLVVQNAEKALNRKIALEDVNLSLFRGIVVHDLEIKEKESEAAFAWVKEFSLSYQLLPCSRNGLSLTRSALFSPQFM